MKIARPFLKWAGGKTQLIPNIEIKWQAYRELSKTDWAVVKCQELGLNPSTKYPDIIEHRASIRNLVNQKEQEIINAQSINELLEIDVYLNAYGNNIT